MAGCICLQKMSLFLEFRELLENIGKDGSSNMNFQFEKIVMPLNYTQGVPPKCDHIQSSISNFWLEIFAKGQHTF